MPIRPMLATLEDAPLVDESLVYEPKYDGIRAIVEIQPGGRQPVRIWSRLGNEKTAQFPDLVAALTGYARKLKGPVVLDGEIVALDEHGEPAGFQKLQGRIHVLDPSNPRSRTAVPRPAAWRLSRSTCCATAAKTSSRSRSRRAARGSSVFFAIPAPRSSA